MRLCSAVLYYLSGLELEHVKLLMKYAIRPAKLRLRKLARKVVARMQGDLSHTVFDAWAD